MARVVKSKADLYQVRGMPDCGWGDIAIFCGNTSVSVMANSDFGSFSYFWSNCGGNPKTFLTEISFEQCMAKLSDGKLYIPAPERYPEYVKGEIAQALEDELITKEQAETATQELLDYEFGNEEVFFNHLYNHELFETVFGDLEGIMDEKKVNPACQDFWDHVWQPFVKQLKAELAETQ